jgi:hypothetical protein
VAGLNDEGQWIILMGLIISVSLMFLAIVVNQSVLVGQTTAESVLDFPKSDIQDLRSEVFEVRQISSDQTAILEDIKDLSLARKHAVVDISSTSNTLTINYNNGVTRYHETIPIY